MKNSTKDFQLQEIPTERGFGGDWMGMKPVYVNKVEGLTDRLWTSYNEITGFQQPVTKSKFPGLTLMPTRMWTKQENAELLSMSLTIYCGWLTYMKLNGNNLE